MATVSRDVILRNNLIKLAQHHKKFCIGRRCSVSLILVAEVIRMAGITLTDKQFEEFM